jgi:hypothetical protein
VTPTKGPCDSALRSSLCRAQPCPALPPCPAWPNLAQPCQPCPAVSSLVPPSNCCPVNSLLSLSSGARPPGPWLCRTQSCFGVSMVKYPSCFTEIHGASIRLWYHHCQPCSSLYTFRSTCQRIPHAFCLARCNLHAHHTTHCTRTQNTHTYTQTYTYTHTHTDTHTAAIHTHATQHTQYTTTHHTHTHAHTHTHTRIGLLS